VVALVSVSPAEQLLTGEFPPLPDQAQLGLQQSQNRLAHPSVPLVGGVHVPELLEVDEALVDDEVELLAPDELEWEVPLELVALDELAPVPPLEEVAALDVPVWPPTPEEAVPPVDVEPAGDSPALPPDPPFAVLPASHDAPWASPTTIRTPQAARPAGTNVRFLEP
jgi:hypothetical protein